MRRLIFITALALSLALPLCAQRGAHAGGVRGGFAGRAGFGGAHFGAGHFSGGMRGGFSHSFHSPVASRGFHSRGFSLGPYLHDGYGRGFRHGEFDRDRYGWGRRGYGYGYRWGWGYYDPWIWDWWNDDSSYDQNYNQNLAIANEMDQQSLAEQRMLRQEEADGDQDTYSQRSYNPHSSSRPNNDAKNEQPSNPIVSPTVLIFRDQHQKEIRNYAIVGQTLWNFAPQHTEKIQLADLDLPATVKANEDRGITFTVPGSGEGQ